MWSLIIRLVVTAILSSVFLFALDQTIVADVQPNIIPSLVRSINCLGSRCHFFSELRARICSGKPLHRFDPVQPSSLKLTMN